MMLALFLQQSGPSAEEIQKFIVPFMAFLSFFMLVGIAIVMIPCWFILKKAGQSPWLSLLCLLPTLGTLILLYILAFSEWRVAPPVQAGWMPQPPFPPQPPYPPRS
jgi:type II secretory pathway component PulF